MQIRFAAQVNGLLPGNFGTNQQPVKRQAYTDLKTLITGPELAAAIKGSSSKIQVGLYSPSDTDSVEIKVTANGLSGRIKDVRPRVFPISEIQTRSAEIIAGLKQDIGTFANLLKLDTSLRSFGKRYKVHGLNLAEFTSEKNSMSFAHLGDKGIAAARNLVNLLKDPDVKAAFGDHKAYKHYEARLTHQENDRETHFREQGGDYRSNPQDPAGLAAYNKIHSSFEMETPQELTLKLAFPNLGFDFDPQNNRLHRGTPEYDHAHITISFPDLAENPAKVKAHVLETQAFWNRKLREAID